MTDARHEAVAGGVEGVGPGAVGPGATSVRSRVQSASMWTMASMGGSTAIRVVSQIALAYLIAPQHFSTIAVMRVFLTGVEMLSEVGIRGSVVYHTRGTDETFLNTAWTLQVIRGICMWLASCALAWPAAAFFDRPVLQLLLPLSGLEAINNGLLSVGMYTRQRGMNLRGPVFVEWCGLAVNLTTAVGIALVHPSVWALAAGPLVGGVVRTGLSHIVFSEVRLRFQLESAALHELIGFGKWIFAGTVAAFVAQQFLTLFFGKFVLPTVHGVYDRSWNYCAQSTRPLTMLANQVMIPLLAESGRADETRVRAQIDAAFRRYLPACLFVCLSVGLFSPTFFGWFFREDFLEGGGMGRFIAIVVWFMILQHAPRSAMLAAGNSRGVCMMMVANALVTVWGIYVGYFLVGAVMEMGAVRGAILGNAFGNVAGCAAGAVMARRHGVPLGRPMFKYSAVFLGLYAVGLWADSQLRHAFPWMTAPLSALLVTLAFALPLGAIVAFRALERSGIRGRLSVPMPGRSLETAR